MLKWLYNLLWDETAFVGYARAAAFGVGGAISSGMLPDDWLAEIPRWLGIVLMAFGGFMRSSGAAGLQMNRTGTGK